MVINDDDIMKLEPFMFENGKNSYFCKTFDENKNPILLKFFYGTDEEIKVKIDTVRLFEKLKYKGINAFPKEIIYINDYAKGYSCDYFEKAFVFLQKKDVPYSLKFKSVLDTTEQLKFLHNNGYIVNDVRLDNHMICPVEKCGFLIDFDDMIFEEDKNIKTAYYRFYEKDTNIVIPPSKQEDVKKQFICHLSLLLEQNFEQFVIHKGEWELLEKFTFQKQLYNFMQILFKGNEILYFDEVSSLFESEELVKEYQKKLKKVI